MINKHLIVAVRLIIAGIFIFSATAKLLAPGFFENIFLSQGIVSDRSVAAIISRVLIGGELAIGLLYLQPFYIKKIVTPISMLLLIGFSFWLVYLMATGVPGNCGCFGGMVIFTPISSLLKNIFILILVVVVYVAEPLRNERVIIPVVLAISAFATTILAAPFHLRTDSLFSRYSDFVGEGKVDLSHGMKLVAVFNVGCNHCQTVASELRSLQKEQPNFPTIYILFYNDGNGSIESFNAQSNTHFPYHLIEEDDYYMLIGAAPPRIYILNDGKSFQYLDDDIANRLKKIIGQHIDAAGGFNPI